MYKTETHMHVSEISPCSHLSAKEMVKLYHEAGYKTLFISDHFSKHVLKGLGDMPWEERIDSFFVGFDNAQKAAEEYGMNVIISAEIQLKDSPNHYLVYGEGLRNFLKEIPPAYELTPAEFYELAHKNGFTVIQAHPYRDDKTLPTPESVDGLEYHNTNPRHVNYDERVLAVAKEHGLLVTSGSDSHRPEDVAKGGVISEEEIKTAADYVRMLKNGELTLINERED